MGAFDWGVGRYEDTASQLEPAARVVVDYAAPTPGEHVVDVGCGTGNAALLAAERGARVTGVDPAPRLLEVASQRAAARGLEARFVRGEAATLPLEDGEADVVLSVFGVIFASDPRASVAETVRVIAPEGRIVLSAWHPSGAVHRAVGAAGEAVRRALGQPAGPPPFPWHEPSALAELFAPHGFHVSVAEERIAFTASSPQAYVDQQADHPLAVAGQAVLGPRGESDSLRERMVAIYEAANEDPDAFRVTSRYIVASAHRET
jgi:SAM-dependent methyltransferase